jgi:hypothetical protein
MERARMTTRPRPASDLADKFMLRLPDGLRNRIRIAADANGRSANSEIVARLLATFGEEPQVGRVADPALPHGAAILDIRDLLTKQVALVGEIAESIRAR